MFGGTKESTIRPALMRRRPLLRNQRFLLGLALVLVSATTGGWLLTSARQTDPYWVSTAPVRAGDPVNAQELSLSEAKLDHGVAEGLLPGDHEPPAGLRWARDVPTGSLIRADDVADEAPERNELPLSVEDTGRPPDLESGDLIDVWVAGSDATERRRARKLLQSVPVRSAGELNGTGRTVVIVDIGPLEPPASVLTALFAEEIKIVRTSR